MANILAVDDEIAILELIKNGLQKDPLRPAEYPPRPLKAVCRQVHMRTQANIFRQHLPERA